METPNIVSAAAGAAPVVRYRDRLGRPYEPAVSPRLRILLALIFAAVAVLGASGIYLLAISVLEIVKQPQTFQNFFSLSMILVHVLVGVAIIIPFLIFGFAHLSTARHRPNRRAVRLGISLFITGIAVCVTGLALIQLSGLPKLSDGTIARWIVRVLHVIVPVAAVVIYVLHRRAGPDIRWSWGIAWGGFVGLFTLYMLFMHSKDPRPWNRHGSYEGIVYFEPSKALTVDGKFITPSVLMMDEYCLNAMPTFTRAICIPLTDSARSTIRLTCSV